MLETDVLIIGAGVIGLSVAAKVGEIDASLNTVLLDRHESFGQETSSRNSEVIHAGIYYPTGSLKASLCVEGKKMLYDFLDKYDIPYENTGKFILARKENEIENLKALLVQGKNNGVEDLKLIGEKKIKKLEPHVNAVAAIDSPSTGIVDTHTLMEVMEKRAKELGCMFGYQHEVVGIDGDDSGYVVTFLEPSGNVERIKTRIIVNSAGLSSEKIVSLIGIDVEREGYEIFPCKGEYFSLPYSYKNMVSRLIYPPPLEELKGLGIHLTKSLDGRLKLGPGVEYVKEIDYSVNPENCWQFYENAKSFLPFLHQDDLEPDMSGIRPKLQKPGEGFRDFVIKHEEDKGLQGFINLIGIESPGLTCCLIIGEKVKKIIEKI